MNFLNLPSFVVLDVAENEDDYCVTVETASPPSSCPHCGAVLVDNLLTRFGRKAQIFMDLPMHAKRVGVKVLRQRYRCNWCMTTFLEVLPDIDDKRMATKRLVTYIEKESLCRTFTSIAHDVGMDEKPFAISLETMSIDWRRQSVLKLQIGWASTRSILLSRAA